MLYCLDNTGGIGLFREVDVLDVGQGGQFLVVPVGHDNGHGIAAHHVLVGTRTAGHQDVLQRDVGVDRIAGEKDERCLVQTNRRELPQFESRRTSASTS